MLRSDQLTEQPTTSNQQKITDYITKSDDKEHTFKVYSNPYGAAAQLPQSTYRKADGFFLVYNQINPESIQCLADYMDGIR